MEGWINPGSAAGNLPRCVRALRVFLKMALVLLSHSGSAPQAGRQADTHMYVKAIIEGHVHVRGHACSRSRTNRRGHVQGPRFI